MYSETVVCSSAYNADAGHRGSSSSGGTLFLMPFPNVHESAANTAYSKAMAGCQ